MQTWRFEIAARVCLDIVGAPDESAARERLLALLEEHEGADGLAVDVEGAESAVVYLKEVPLTLIEYRAEE